MWRIPSTVFAHLPYIPYADRPIRLSLRLRPSIFQSVGGFGVSALTWVRNAFDLSEKVVSSSWQRMRRRSRSSRGPFKSLARRREHSSPSRLRHEASSFLAGPQVLCLNPTLTLLLFLRLESLKSRTRRVELHPSSSAPPPSQTPSTNDLRLYRLPQNSRSLPSHHTHSNPFLTSPLFPFPLFPTGLPSSSTPRIQLLRTQPLSSLKSHLYPDVLLVSSSPDLCSSSISFEPSTDARRPFCFSRHDSSPSPSTHLLESSPPISKLCLRFAFLIAFGPGLGEEQPDKMSRGRGGLEEFGQEKDSREGFWDYARFD